MTGITDAARILEDGSPARRAALAADPATPPEALYYLMADSAPAIRAAVAANPAGPHQTFATLAADDDQAVRQALATRLAALARDLPAAQQDRVAQVAWSALAQLAGDAAEEIRATIAEAVKDLPDAPRAMMLALARDTSLRVADPVIRLCPLLTEEDLLGLVAAPPIAATLTAIARRPTISETVAEALVATGDPAAIGALLGNRTAAIRESTLDALVVQAAERTAWQEPLVRRPDRRHARRWRWRISWPRTFSPPSPSGATCRPRSPHASAARSRHGSPAYRGRAKRRRMRPRAPASCCAPGHWMTP